MRIRPAAAAIGAVTVLAASLAATAPAVASNTNTAVGPPYDLGETEKGVSA